MTKGKTAKKYKPMTKREKEERKAFRAQLRAEGIMSPVKPKLNRKKFLLETFEMWEQADAGAFYYLLKGVSCMISKNQTKVTTEEVGAIKVMRLALEIQAFEKKLAAENRTSYTAQEFYEHVKPILDL